MAVIYIEEQEKLSTWSKLDVVPGNIYCWTIGDKNIYMKRLDDKWLFSEKEHHPNTASEKDSEDQLNALQWTAYVGSRTNAVQPVPALPERPLVLKPGSPIKVLPQSSVLLFLEVPCSIQFYSESRKEDNFIHETASKSWSSTWFGEPDNGELAYSLPFETSKVFDKSEPNNRHSIICPVKVFNDAMTILDVQRLLLHGEHLNIYGNQNELCSNEVRIRFKGETVISDVEYDPKTPSYIKNAKLLAPARASKSNNVISKSFHFIKSLASS